MRAHPTIIFTGSKVTARRHLREQRFAKRDRQVRRKAFRALESDTSLDLPSRGRLSTAH